ncbi:maleylpyruvate isomerase N-terminal domain-containing protein, partial [Actinacidiphila rubida]
MSGQAYRNGGEGGGNDEDGDVPRVPHQREQGGGQGGPYGPADHPFEEHAEPEQYEQHGGPQPDDASERQDEPEPHDEAEQHGRPERRDETVGADGADGADANDANDGRPDGPGLPGPPAVPSLTARGLDRSSGGGGPVAPPASAGLPQYDHTTLKSLLGAWALTACSQDESLAVEVHLTDCAACADEALRLRDAVGLLHQEESLDLDPLLRARVLEGCLGRRPARIPVPDWAGPYDAEAARLDALLRDLGDGYWKAPVELRWFDEEPVSRQFTVGQVIAHLTAVDSLVARALGLPGPGGGLVPPGQQPEGSGGPGPATRARFWRARGDAELPVDPGQRTEAHWAAARDLPGATLRSSWREQSHTLVRTVSFAGSGASGLEVDYGESSLPLRDAFVDRAFECWLHAGDIAEAVDYPYEPPAPRHLHRMIDLAARLLPSALAAR